MKIDLDDLERDTKIAENQDRKTLELLRGDGVPLEQTAFRRGYSARSPSVILALIARIRELYDVAYSALSLIATERSDAWSEELVRIKATLERVVAVFGDSVVGSVEVVDFERGAS